MNQMYFKYFHLKNIIKILASCGCDGFLKIWDIRVTNSQPILSIQAHPGVDINVISWNKFIFLLSI